MQSLKQLLEKRNQLVADARSIMDRQNEKGTLSADEAGKVDELLGQAGDIDAKIEEIRKFEGRRDRLAELEAKLSDAPVGRQIDSLPPGSSPRRGEESPLSYTLGRHTMSLRPGSSEAIRASDGYRQRFMDYLTGNFSGHNGHERLGLHTGEASKGGYLVPMSMLGGLIKFLDDAVFMRQLGTVLPATNAKSVGVLSYDTDLNDADWTAEIPASDLSEDAAARFGKREMMPHLLTKLLKMSNKILRSSDMDLEAFMISRLGYKFSITEEKAFLTGSGSQQPLGVFIASNDGITTSQDITCASATAFTADELINALHDLKGPYQARATWLASREFVKRCRKLKDGNGQYLWQPGLASNTPGLILDRPYVMSEHVPATYTTGLYVGAVGDFSHYWIQDGMSFEVQRLNELFSLRNQVGFVARKETDGMPVLAEAFRRIKLG